MPNPTSIISRRGFLLQVYLLLALYVLLLPAFLQFIDFGYFFYTNGHDEADYLSYEFSSNSQGLKRLSSFLVTHLHNLGFSGGTINFLFDLIALTMIGLIIPRLVKNFYPTARTQDQYLASSIICLTPILLTFRNPVIKDSILAIQDNDLLRYYVVSGGSRYPIYMRTPESQTSICIGILILWLLTKAGKTRWFILCTPFLYYYVGILWFAIAFVYFGAEFIKRRYDKAHIITPILLSAIICFFFIGLAQAIIFRLSPIGRLALISHEPVFGLSFFILAAIYSILVTCRKKWGLDANTLLFLSSVVSAVVVVYNSNVISGFVVQPHHFEFEVELLIGVFLGIFFLKYVAKDRKLIKVVFATFFFFATFIILDEGTRIAKWVVKTDAKILESLRALPGFENDLVSEGVIVAIDNISFSSKITGLYLPKGRVLATAREGIFLANDAPYHEFLTFKSCVERSEPIVIERMTPVVEKLQNMFRDKLHDFLPLYQARRNPTVYTYSAISEEGLEDYCSRLRVYLIPRRELLYSD